MTEAATRAFVCGHPIAHSRSPLIHLLRGTLGLLMLLSLLYAWSMSAAVAHELRNPLNFMNNFARLTTELVDELFEVFDANLDGLTDDEEGCVLCLCCRCHHLGYHT